MKPGLQPDAAMMLGLEPAAAGDEAQLLGGKDNEGGGYDADARRLKTALEGGDGNTVYSIMRSIIEDVLERRGPGPSGGPMMEEIDED